MNLTNCAANATYAEKKAFCNLNISDQTPITESPLGRKLTGPIIVSTKEIIQITALCLVFLFGTVGNGLVIRVFGFTSQRKLAGTTLVVVLALTDLVSSILVPLDALTHISMNVIHRYSQDLIKPWPHGKIACYILKSSNSLLVTSSSWLLVAISLERFR